MQGVSEVRALKRALQVLRIVNRGSGVRASDIARNAGLPRPTAYRLLETLEALGFVVLGPSDDKWRPTLKAKSLSAGFCDETWVVQYAMPHMLLLQQEILWPVDLLTHDAGQMVVRESTHNYSPFSVDVGMLGRRLPMLSTAAGRAYLAFAREDERQSIVAQLNSTADGSSRYEPNLPSLDVMLDGIRSLGVGYRIDGFRPNTSSIAAPIICGKDVVGCLSVIWIRSALSLDEALARFAKQLRQTCNDISASMCSATAEGSGVDRVLIDGPLAFQRDDGAVDTNAVVCDFEAR
jgi:IclR family mhp operon transcriptional activator